MARGAQGTLYIGHLHILVEPLQSIRPHFLGGFGIKVLVCVVEEGVVGTLKHLHFLSLVSLRESRFQFGFLACDALVFSTVDAQYRRWDVRNIL